MHRWEGSKWGIQRNKTGNVWHMAGWRSWTHLQRHGTCWIEKHCRFSTCSMSMVARFPSWQRLFGMWSRVIVIHSFLIKLQCICCPMHSPKELQIAMHLMPQACPQRTENCNAFVAPCMPPKNCKLPCIKWYYTRHARHPICQAGSISKTLLLLQCPGRYDWKEQGVLEF